MTASLERRGPEGTHHWYQDRVALGHTLLATTPEALIEVMPLTIPASGCTITADARLDNRTELIARLGLEVERRTIGDGELILLAYISFGEACLDYLLGDFAFAIWDCRKDRLFCARDHFGMRQLTYCYVPERVFVFSTEPRSILTHANVPCHVNEVRIANFLEDLEGKDLSSTFFESINRLPPAHFLTIDASGLSLQRYWTLIPGPELKLSDNDAYAKAFLNIFSEAVQCRLRSARPVGSMLSGGMDSGAIVAVASKLIAHAGGAKLQTFSATNSEAECCNETRAIHIASTIPDLIPHFISCAELDAYADDLIRLTQANDEPLDGYMALIRAVYLAAGRAGINVMLDGVSGDSVLAEGSFIARLLRGGHVLQAIQEARGVSRFWGQVSSTKKVILSAVWQAFAPWWLRYARFQILFWQGSRSEVATSMLAPEFANRTHMKERKREIRLRELLLLHESRMQSSAEERARIIDHTHLTDGRERYDRIASALAIEPRDPFLDLRVVQFCLSLPMTQLQGDGWLKKILRNAMEGYVPDAVRWRRGKENLGVLFTQTLMSKWPSWWVEVFPVNGWLGRYVAYNQARQPQKEKIGALQVAPSFKLFYLNSWLCTQLRLRRDVRKSDNIFREQKYDI